MSLDTRLTKLMPTLTARERAILVLGSFKDKTPEDPSWRSTMPPSQSAEFNRYIGLMNATNIHLGWVITLLEQLAARIELRQCWYVTLRVWAEHLDEIEAAVDACLPPLASKVERKQRKELKRVFDWAPAGGAVVLARLTESLTQSLPSAVADGWSQLRALESVIDEVAAEFDGVDPLTVRNREGLTRARQALLDRKEQLECLGLKCELGEAAEEDLEPLRLLLKNAQR
ncbi:MAG TPA: hypothetical protein VJB57_19800 [Dehalococcoidia bacterium]|nr:hypothetical protein [Dehalococcoidia bacterium]